MTDATEGASARSYTKAGSGGIVLYQTVARKGLLP
jgi:hypothetical protein